MASIKMLQENPKTILLQKVVNKCFGTTLLRLNINSKSLELSSHVSGC